MVVHKPQLPVALALLLGFCAISSGLPAQNIVFPNGELFINKAVLFSAPGLSESEVVLPVVPDKPIQLQKNDQRPGFASFRFSSDPEKLPRGTTRGKLEVFLFIAGEPERVRFDASLTKKHPDELTCDAGSVDTCTSEANTSLKMINSSNLLSKPGPLMFLSSDAKVMFSEINFVSPLVAWDSGHCRINKFMPSSICSPVDAVIMRFTPLAFEEPEVVVAHTLNSDVLTKMEQTLANAEAFLRDDKKLQAMAENVLAFKFARSSELVGTGWQAWLKNLAGYYFYGSPWIYGRDLLFPGYPALPEEGVPAGFIDSTAKLFKEYHHSRWKRGKVSGTIYSGDLGHYDFLNRIHGYFSHDNVIQFDLAPGGIYFESNVIAMVRSILGGSHIQDQGLGEPDGIITGGGTSSIKSALKAYRDRAAARGITEPEIILPESAHPAFERGAHDFGMKVVKARIFKEGTEPAFTLDLMDVKEKITPNTVLLVGSATNYPYGTMDSITGLAALARQYDLDLHVDACLGGFVLAFLDLEKYGLEPFDFRIPEVTSISIDTHKYGKALKGSSVLLLRDSDLSDYLGYINTEWEGGIYAASGLVGSASVGDYAAPWASLLKTGAANYRAIAVRLVEFAQKMTEVIRSYPDELYVMGTHAMCFAFTSRPGTFDIMHIKDYLGDLDERWRFNQVQNPAGLHFCVTGPQLSTEGLIDTFRQELDEAVRYARLMEKEKKASSGGGIYGMGNLGIRFNSPEEIESFIRAGGYLLRDSARPVPPLLERFKNDYRRVLYKQLGIRGARDKQFDSNEI